MLILTRRPGEALLIEPNPETGKDAIDCFGGGAVCLRVIDVRRNVVRLGIEAPQALRILREELLNGSGFRDSVTPSPREALARKVRMLRDLHRWSSSELARLAGLSITVVMHIESANGNVELSELDAVARVFGLTVPELFLPPGRTSVERKLMAVLASRK